MALAQLIALGAQDIHFLIDIDNDSDLDNDIVWDYKYNIIENEDDKLCCVTFNTITDDYIKCSCCNKNFDLEVKELWIKENNKCPHCRQEWTNYFIYKNSEK